MSSTVAELETLVPAYGDAAAVSCHVNDVPPYLEDELVRLYGHVHSSLPFFETSRPMENARVYVARDGGRPSAIFVFTIRRGELTVFNEMARVSRTEIERFAAYAFRQFPQVSLVRFPAVETDRGALRFPTQRYDAKEDWVVDLAPTPEAYMASLGKKTRDTIKSHMRKLVREHPSFTVQVHRGEQICPTLVRDIIALSRANIFAKKKMFGIDEAEADRIVRLSRRIGVVVALRIDGRLCGGSVNYAVGDRWLGEVIAHDAAFNRYSLGGIVCHLTLCESIARGARKFHMGGGRNPYKAKAGGIRHDMECLVLYRSYAHLALNGHKAARVCVDRVMRRAKVWMLEHDKSVLTRAVFNTLHILRSLVPGRRGGGGAPPVGAPSAR
ncbi:MAG TPA: GNAT family N-acetyltransferase [Azospirillum sp.]|nr:GNAT family N-acetyltransferase [Azospirillum sp.]